MLGPAGFADRRPDDLLLLHFSCHGVKDEIGELYFAMTNTLRRRLGATAVAARVGAGAGIEAHFGGRGRAVDHGVQRDGIPLRGDDLADARELSPSVFTGALVEGLETG